MTLLTASGFIAAAALGAVVRFSIGWFACFWKAVLVANVVGSGLLGAVLGADLSGGAATVLATGLCGSLTSFSALALQLRAFGRPLVAAGYATFTVACAVGALSVGYALVEST